MSSSSKANASSTPEALQALPSDWVPGEHDVVIGKGKKFYFHTGNQWLRTLVASMLEEYKIAQTKSDKSNIISDVVEYVRQHGRFVKRDIKSGKWVMAEPLLCREKCSQTFRDNLAETYRSSNVAKRNKRRAEQQEKKRVPQAKRIRTDGVSGVGAPTAAVNGMPPLNGMALNLVQQHQQAHQAQVQAPAPIPANLFDLGDMPKQRSNSLLTGSLGGLDFSALSRGSITGSAGGMDNGLNLGSLNFNNNANVLNNNNNNNGNVHNNNAAPAPQLNLNGLNSVNLMQSLPDILSNLTQLVSNQNQAAAPAPTADGTTVGNSYNPFEPTPMGAFGLPPLTGEHQAPAAASMPTLDLQNLGALFEPQQPMQEKRHSLALIGDSFDWLKAANNAAAGNTTQEDDAKIPTAFAA